MDINISADELTLLAYLHEHATGYTPADILTRKPMQDMLTSLNLSLPEFRKQVTFLASFGLVGVSEIVFTNTMGGGAEINGVGITGAGENYIRELEAELEKGNRASSKRSVRRPFKCQGRSSCLLPSKC
jgi:hypothetical protein